MHIRSEDTVEVIAGADKGVRARVVRVLPKRDKVLVEGVNKVYKHLRRSQKNPQGGRLSREMPIAVSNVKLVCPNCSQASRTGMKLGADGKKELVCKNCQKTVRVISPARTAAKKK